MLEILLRKVVFPQPQADDEDHLAEICDEGNPVDSGHSGRAFAEGLGCAFGDDDLDARFAPVPEFRVSMSWASAFS